MLHIEAGKPTSTKGQELQQIVQETLQFDVNEIRQFAMKTNETYIPFEVIDSKEKMDFVKAIIKEIREKYRK